MLSVRIAAETVVGIGPFSDPVLAETLEDGMTNNYYHCVNDMIG